MLAALGLALVLQGPLAARLDPLLDIPALRGGLTGVCVMAEDGTTLYERNADVRIVPASNQKLFSVSFALHELGPDWRPVTRMWNLPDRVVLDCPGDPSMSYDTLQKLASAVGTTSKPVFARQGYRVGVPPTWENDDLPHRYAPRITSLTVNEASFTVAAEGGKVVLLPAPFGIRVTHYPGGSYRGNYDPEGPLLRVHGDLPQEKKNLENFALPDPDRAAASILGRYLMATTTVPSTSPTMTVEGTRVGELAKLCLQPSDNYLAESLMLLAAMKTGPLGEDPYTSGPARLRDFVTKTVGLSREDFRPYDGSGMSRHNYVTARGVCRLLNWARRQPTAELWMDALAKPGVGTLSSRLQGSSFIGKTGSLNSVASLSGYVRTPDGRLLAVCIIANHFIVSASEVRAAADAVIRELEKPGSFAS